MTRLQPYIALFAAGLFWGFGLPCGKLALRETDSAHMILLRFLVAGLAATGVALVRRGTWRLLARPAVLMSGVFYALGFLAQFEGLARTSVTVAALLIGLMPALIALSAAATGERVGGYAWIGIAAATLGAALIAGRPGAATLGGVLLCLASLPLFLGWLYATRAAMKAGGALEVACAGVMVAAVLLLVIVTAMHGPPRLDLSPAAWSGIVGQGLLSTVAATLCWQLGAPKVSTAAAGVFINVEPVVGTALGVAFFHDRLTGWVIAGGLTILAGSLTVVLGERRTPGGVSAAEDAPTPA